MPAKAQSGVLFFVLASLALTTFLGKSDQTTLRGIDSNIHASAALAVTSAGFLPRLPIVLRGDSEHAVDQVFNDHPFTLFWLNGHVMRAWGPSAWSARLLTALFSVGSVLLVFLIGSHLQGQTFGLLSAVFAIFSRDFILTSATMSLDTALVFFILLSFYFWRRRFWVGLSLAAGFGLWIKTPVVLLVFPTALLVEAVEGTLRRNFRTLVLCGVAALVLGSGVWILTGVLGGWSLVTDYWSRQLWGTAVGGRGSAATGFDPGFWLYTIRTGFLPGLPFLAVGLYRILLSRKLRSRNWRQPGFLIPAVAVSILSIVVTAMRFKLGHYYTPIFPFLAMIASFSCVDWLEKHQKGFHAALIGVTTVLLAVLVTSPIPLGQEGFVALRKFAPFIVTHGECSDRILLVSGGEPVGSALDARLFLNFYTGRAVDTVACATLREHLAKNPAPQWLIIGHKNLQSCLGPSDRSKFTHQILMGSQYLLTSQIPPGTVDLTPLNLESKAAVDCKAPPYPRDMWHQYTFE